MSNRFRPRLAAGPRRPLYLPRWPKRRKPSTSAIKKANIFALLKYRGTLDESLKKQGIAVRWVEFPPGRKCWRG